MAFDEAVAKHLDFIQGVVTRMANNSFLLKGWALTVAGAFYGFAAKGSSVRVAAIGLMPVLVFWGLDAYYLRQERLFRKLYDAVRAVPPAEPPVAPYSMNTQPYQGQVASWLKVAFSRTEWPYYGVIFVIGVVLTASL